MFLLSGEAAAQESSGTGAPDIANVEVPQVEVVRNYELGIGTSEAASAGKVTEQRVQETPVLRTGEVLELVPGVIVTQHSGEGKANQYYLRGFNLDHGTDFGIWVDGMPVNMPTHGHGQGYADLSFVIPELISGIEYRKGPYRASDGDFSSAGSSYIGVSNAVESGLGLVTLGSFDYQRALVVDSSKVGSGGELLYAAEYMHNDGPWNIPDDFRKINAVLRYSRGNADGGLSITGMAYDGNWTSTDQIPQRAIDQGIIDRWGSLDPTDGGESSRYSLSARGYGSFDQGTWAVDAYVIRYRMNLWSNFTYFLDDPVNGDQFEQADSRLVYGLHSHGSRYHALLGRDSTTTVGLQMRYDDIDNVALYSTRARQRLSTTREDTVEEGSIGVYIENLTFWSPWLRTVAGVRADYFNFDVDSSIPANSGSLNDTVYSPKVSFVFGPWARTEYFANYGYGFHSNDARGTVISVDPKTLAPADPVTPLVKTQGAEIGVKTEIIEGLQSTLALWRLDSDSELLFVGDAGTTEPSRPSRRQGVEWNNHWLLNSWLLADLDLAWSKSRFTDDDPAGDYIPGSVEQVVSAGLTAVDYGPWSGSVVLRYFGARPLVEDNSVRSASTTLVNARAGYRFNKTWKTYLDVFNLFDREDSSIDYYYDSQLPGEAGPVSDIHFHPVEPRSFRLSVTANF
ncbi:MAG: TonB-denpendent receptor [Betaproteobacteria bacterium SG8_40]|nr:MAG: TonB-denpendent receptor [Betaproteobacteria bacterium SG8_40]